MKLLIAEHYTGKGGSTALYVARQNILPGYCGWPLAQNTPFKANIDQTILAFHGVIIFSLRIWELWLYNKTDSILSTW